MKTKLTILLFCVIIVFGCKSRTSYNSGTDKRAMAPEMEKMESLDEAISPPPPPPPPASQQANSSIEKKIIKTAYLNIEVLNFQSTRKLIDSTIKKYDAYIMSENLQNTEYQITSNINIKVPAERFEKLLADIAKLAKKVEYQNIESQDVTEEYIDVESRLNNSKKVEQTYLRLLRRTTSIEDILKIEQKLGEIRSEIESTQGRLKYLSHQVSFSTINLSVYQKLEYKYVPEKSEGFFQRLKKSIDQGWKGIVAFILFLIKLWPLWLIAFAGWYGWKYFVRYRKEKRAEAKHRKKLEKKLRKEQKGEQEVVQL